LGSQSRRSGRGRRGGRRSGGGGGRGGGGGGGEENNTERTEREQIYRTALGRAKAALKSENFSYAAHIATSVAVTRTPVQEAMTLFVAGARAFSEGKDKKWEPKPAELAEQGIRYAQEKIGYELGLEGQRLFSAILRDNLKKVAEKQRRKQP